MNEARTKVKKLLVKRFLSIRCNRDRILLPMNFLTNLLLRIVCDNYATRYRFENGDTFTSLTRELREQSQVVALGQECPS